MNDKDAQLAILADALTKIVDVAPISPATTMSVAKLLARTGNLAVQALVAAATDGPLPSSTAPIGLDPTVVSPAAKSTVRREIGPELLASGNDRH